MTDDHGLTVRTLRHEKGKLTMVSREDTAPTPANAINDPPELVEMVARAIADDVFEDSLTIIGDKYRGDALRAIAAVRQWDREQRGKIDEMLARAGYRISKLSDIRPNVDRTAPEPSREPSSNPDDYTDPFNMVTRSESGGLTEWKRG